jgi:hypothetical protein
MRLMTRLRAAWRAFRKPLPMVDPEIAAMFPEIPTEFRQTGGARIITKTHCDQPDLDWDAIGRAADGARRTS